MEPRFHSDNDAMRKPQQALKAGVVARSVKCLPVQACRLKLNPQNIQEKKNLGVVPHTCNSSCQEAEIGRFLVFSGKPV